MKPLTEREREVMKLLCLGYANKTIAEHFNCSIKTVEKHRQAIYYKWSVGSLIAMIRVALRSGEITLPDFVSSGIGEDARHEIPQNLERIKTYA